MTIADRMESLQRKHFELMKSGMESLLGDEELSDVDIIVNHRVFKCHKSVLASLSPYFRVMFTGGMKEAATKQGTIRLKDMDDLEIPFEKLVGFLYTGKVSMTIDDVPDMLLMAAHFQIDILRDHCEELLLEQLKGDNCIEMYRLACLYNCPNLELKAWPSMLDGFTNLWKTYDYDNLTLNEIISIIREDRLVTLDEEHVCEAVCKWIDFDLDQRSKYAFKLLCHVRLPHISREYLVYHLSRVQYFIDDPQCRRLIEEVKHFHMLPARMLDYSSPRMKYRADDELEEVLLVITENSDDRGSFYQGGWCLWAFSYHQRRWFTLAPIPLADSPGMNFAICSYGYDIFLSGGTSNPKSLLKFESQRNEWVTSTGQLKKVRVQHTMNAVSSSLYCIGGRHPKFQQVNGSIEEYNILGQRWRTVGELNHPVYSTTSTVCGEQILLFGGIGKDNKPMNYVQCFHTRTKDSSVISTLPYLCKRIITTTMGDEVFITSIDEDDSSLVLKLTSEFGFTDAGIELPVDSKILAITHSEGQLVVVTENEKCKGYLGDIVRVNVKNSKSVPLEMQGTNCPRPVHACHRLYVDNRFLYHTYFQ
ncbi:kelch-like protein 24 isoform X2 [Mya arenaria]|nr:kelch-like protein 24 isoform X2 [Mya arenaria]XP_052789259.1 kelch-like protein 24 isoform X2 [Mya arenaria]XP_052789260.1 kelch-like protein 24 isoform X2 [Mya arenaria]